MSHRLINAALASHLQAMGEPTAFENAPFTPPEGAYLAEAYLPATTTPIGVETSSTDDYVGLYQVTVVAPRDAYKLDGYTLADQVAVHFARGTTLTQGAVRVRIERVEQEAPLYAGDRWQIPLSIRWRALIK